MPWMNDQHIELLYNPDELHKMYTFVSPRRNNQKEDLFILETHSLLTVDKWFVSKDQ